MKPIGLIGEELTGSAIGAFFAVYDALGSGFLEHVYAAALERELRSRGHHVAREVSVPVFYKGEKIAFQRLDILVDGKLVIEVKAAQDTPTIGNRQLLNYLRATRLEIGLLFSFGPQPTFKRVVSPNALKLARGESGHGGAAP
jgi:GxxExxY protein